MPHAQKASQTIPALDFLSTLRLMDLAPGSCCAIAGAVGAVGNLPVSYQTDAKGLSARTHSGPFRRLALVAPDRSPLRGGPLMFVISRRLNRLVGLTRRSARQRTDCVCEEAVRKGQ